MVGFIGRLSMLFWLLAAGCADQYASSLSTPTVDNTIITGKTFLTGEFVSESGVSISLRDLGNKPLILVFGSETCIVCQDETRNFAKHFAEHGVPTEVHFFTVLLGSSYLDITDWRSIFLPMQVDWSVGVDENLILYDRYFAELKTPSILYFDPATTVLKRWQAPLSVSQLAKETGPWK